MSINKLNQAKSWIDIVPIARNYDIKIFQIDIQEKKGYIKVDENSKIIILNKNNSLEEKRFLIALSLGYIVNLENVKEKIIKELKYEKDNSLEYINAYNFAIKVLMPDVLVEKMISEYSRKFYLDNLVNAMISAKLQVPLNHVEARVKKERNK